MDKNKKYHGYSKQQFLISCAKNIILQIPYEQDYLLLSYGPMINEVLIHYLRTTTKDNLEMIYQNQFEFKMKFDELNNVFNYKFDYYH